MTARKSRPLVSARKRRPDAWEIRANLSDDAQAKIMAWARALGYRKAMELCKSELRVMPPSVSNFQAWYEMRARLENDERVHRAIVDSGAIRQLAEKTGDVSEAMAAALEAEAAAAILGNDPERIKLLVGLALKARSGQFEERKYRDAMKSAIERGLDALAAETQGHPEALDLYNKFRAAILQSVEAAA